jgi:hypothetical protein
MVSFTSWKGDGDEWKKKQKIHSLQLLKNKTGAVKIHLNINTI